MGSTLLLQDAEIAAAAGIEEPALREPWDTPFNRAINVAKKRPKNKKMTSSGRVAGFGLSTKVGIHFKEDAETRKERRTKREEEQARKIQHLEAQVAEMEAKMEEKLRQMLPPQLWEGLAKWNAAGGVGPIPVPSVSGSNSHQHASPNMVTPPSNPLVHPLALVSPQPAAAAPNTDVQPAAPAPNTNAQPAPLLQDEREQELTQPRVSTLAELDALTQVSVECFIVGSTSHTMNNT